MYKDYWRHLLKTNFSSFFANIFNTSSQTSPHLNNKQQYFHYSMAFVPLLSFPNKIYMYAAIGVPEVPKHCELRNDSVMEVICQAGHDGGLQQHFVLEAIGATSTYFNNLDSTRSTHEI